MKKSQFRMKKNSGFSLGELLAVVAILVILLAVSLPAVVSIQKNLRQKELDAKAEIIYVAAQNAISKLKAGGNTRVYQLGAVGVGQLSDLPDDADREMDNIDDGDICYFTSAELLTADSAASAIMSSSTVDEALLNNHWVVEYNPSSAIIYAVFYSEDLVDCAGGEDGYLNNFTKYDFNLRYKSQRLDDGARVGYYGGGSAASNSTVTTMTPTLTVINTEKLVADISCVLPTSISDYPVFKVELKDDKGNTYTKYYAYINCSLDYMEKIEKEAGGVGNVDYISMEKNGRVFTLKLFLDDLSSPDTRFHKKYPDLEAGTALTVTVTAMCPGNYTYTQNLSDTKTTNSLFADDSTGDTAVISYARHLQNLDKDSGVSDTIKNAKQNSDIAFTDQLPAVSSDRYIDWYETYNAGYFNGRVDGVPNFKPIQNSDLQSYDGDSKRIAKLTAEVDADSDAGLFAALGDGQTVSNVFLTGTRVRSQNGSAGALVGKVTGSTAIEQCQVYLTTTDIKAKNNHDVWIQGKTAGGLIGTVSGNGAVVTNSAASTVVGGHTYSAGAVRLYDADSAGGLVGSVATGGGVTITGSYADCYLFGREAAGGLVGTSSGTVQVSSCYAAGFATFQAEGAGLVCGKAVMENSYTVLCYQDMPESGWNYFSTAKDGTTANVYYNVGSFGAGSDLLNSKAIDITLQELTDKLNGAGSAAFTADTTASLPYNLMDQGLITYPFPVLSALKKHYGDWMADFQEGTLVYYEEYKDGTYGFYGANVESTLKNDPNLIVVGDGYGVVYQEKEDKLLPSGVTVTCEGAGSETLSISSNKNFYPVTGKNGTAYRIYPLSKAQVNTENASSDFYLNIRIGSDAYFFNPHFAKTVVENKAGSSTKPTLDKDQMISVRTARHLYMMSLYYDTYANATMGCTFAQERNIDYASYDWTGYSTRTDDKSSQAPIAGGDTAFQATYDGGCHWITNVNFTTKDGLYVGFIGQNAGTVKDVVLTATYKDGSADNYHVRRSGNIENNRAVYMGVLVGRNFGTINNCAASGYYIAGSDGTIHAYENSYLYAGGLVGGNAGTITNCSADTPALRLSSAYANAYLGGFVGTNSSYISSCYALGHIEVAFAKGGGVSIAGFAGRNTDIIRDSYCATALTSSGEVTISYGFAPFGGQVSTCYYLNHGTYTYVNHMYPFNFDACAGTSAAFTELKNIGAGKRAVNSYNFQNTKTDIGQYPFRAVVQDESGNLIHYGDWLDDENMGDVGIFYWEREEGGSNNGYHFTYLGTEETGETVQTMGGTTLCNAHDDGGVITEYGYGYFALSKDSVTELKLEGATINGDSSFKWNTGNYNEAASEALQKQMHKTLEGDVEAQYYFYAFTTGKDGLCLSETEPNCTWILMQNNGEKKEYTVSPFFANAMSFKNAKDTKKVTAFDGKVTDYSREPGAGGGDEDNQYEIRSIQQLQYINWNHNNKNTSTLITKDNYVNQFTYLMYAKDIGVKSVTQKSDITDGQVMYWRQTHDVDGSEVKDYTPIAGNRESTTNGSNNYSVPLYAWFGGNYNGESYKIQNVSIESNSYAVGLFGVTVGANMKNIIMYGDKEEAVIKRCNTNNKDVGAYAIGGMIGVAYDYNIKKVEKSTNYIENCAIAGYKIVDGSTNQQGLGEVNVGGLTGVANVHLKNCSAVTQIVIDARPKKAAVYGNITRVGGLTGAAQGIVANCYSGGSTELTSEFLNTHTDYSGCSGNNNGHFKSTRVYVGGVVGSGFTSNYKNFTGNGTVSDGQPYIKNCYTYFTFPEPLDTGDQRDKELYCYTVGSLADRAHEQNATSAKITIENCYYLDSIKKSEVDLVVFDGEPYNTPRPERRTGEPVSQTYTQMSDGTLLNKLGGIFEGDNPATGSVTNKNAGYHNVTTTEGSANVPINGKYSFPGSNYSLEGKNYPFPAIVQQNDLTFGTVKDPVYVYVHYGDWPIDGPYWIRGRDTMDIFADMQADGYAKKTFYLNPNGKELGELTPEMFVCDPDNSIAQVVAVGERDSNGWYPVTIMAKNTGTAIVTFTKNISEEVTYTADFSLEVTAELDVKADPATLWLKVGEAHKETVTLLATSAGRPENDYSADGIWSMEVVEKSSKDLVTLTQLTQKNKWNVKRDGLGRLTLRADFEYDYHGVKFTAAAYVYVLQPDTVGLSDGKSYDVAYLETGVHVTSPSYTTKPSTEDGNFFLYLDAETLKIGALDIKSIYVTAEGGTAKEAQKKGELGNVYYETSGVGPNFRIEWDEPTSDENYQYRSGSMYVMGGDDVQNVELKVTVASSDGAPCTLSVKLTQVKKALTITYQDSMEAGAQSFTKQVSVGKHKLPTQSEAKALCGTFSVPTGKMLEGWRVVNADHTVSETVYPAGETYNFTADVQFTAEWKDAIVTLYANGGKFADGETVNELLSDSDGKVNLSVTPTRGSYAFNGWSTNADGTGDHYAENAVADVSALAPEYALYARWKPYTLTLVKDGGSEVFTNVTGISLSEYDSSDFTRDGYTLYGWYTSPDASGTMVLDKSGNVVANVDGYSYLDELALTGNQTLYACWHRPKRYVLTESLTDGYDYLLVSTNKVDEPAETSLAFGQTKQQGGKDNQNNVPVTVNKDAFGKMYIVKDDMPLDAVFRCSEGGKLNNSAGYLNVKLDKKSGKINYQYELKNNGNGATLWGYFGNDVAKPDYNRNTLYDKSVSEDDLNLDPNVGNNANQTKARRFTYMGRIAATYPSWAANAFTVKATKDANTDMYIYVKQDEGYEFSTGAALVSAIASVYSARAAAPAKSAVLTLMDGTRTVLSTAVPSGTATVTGYTAPVRVNSEWTLQGWYTAKDGTGTKVLNADGTMAGEPGVSPGIVRGYHLVRLLDAGDRHFCPD